MNLIYGFLKGLLSVFSALTPLSYSGHDSLFRYLSFDLESGGYDSILPLTVKLAIIISISYFLKKDLVSLFKGAGSLLKNNKENSKELNLLYTVFAGGLVLLLMIPLRLLLKGIESVILITACGFFLSALYIIHGMRVKEKNLKESNESILNGIIISFFKVLSVIPGISGFGGMYYGGLISGVRREYAVKYAYLITLVWAVFSFIYELILNLSGGFVFNFGILYYIGFFLGAVGIGGIAVYSVYKAIESKKMHWFIIYNVGIGILTLLILVRG